MVESLTGHRAASTPLAAARGADAREGNRSAGLQTALAEYRRVLEIVLGKA